MESLIAGIIFSIHACTEFWGFSEVNLFPKILSHSAASRLVSCDDNLVPFELWWRETMLKDKAQKYYLNACRYAYNKLWIC